MRVGILPAPNCGLRTLDAAGQLSRFTRHFTAYRDAGHDLSYFSCLPNELEWIADMVLPLAPPSPRNGIRRALLRPLRQPRAFKACQVLRAMSLSAAFSGITARLVYGIPFVVTHGARYEQIATLHGRAAWKWNALRRLVFRLASVVIVPNPEQATELQGRFPRTRIARIPNWVDTEMFRPAPPMTATEVRVARMVGGLGNGAAIVLYVGRLVVEKNLERLAAVCAKEGWRLVCLGEGPLRAHLTARGVCCPGAVRWDDLPAWHARASVFCLPSFTEGHPKALIEAMASGLPCAVSNGVTGIVRAGWSAITFHPEDDEEMTTALRALLDNKRLAAAMGQGAREASMAYDVRAVLPREIRVVEGVA